MRPLVYLITGIAMCALLVGSVGALAQVTDSIQARKNLTDLNRLKPLQNPRYVQAKHILKRRILDSHNKVVGDVEDVLINNTGEVFSIRTDFDRLRLGGSVFLNTETFDIGHVSKGYQVGFDDDEIVDMYPSLLAGIDTAAGQSDIVSLVSAIDRSIVTSKGYRIGHVDDVLFDRSGKKAEAFYVVLNYKTLHNEGIAVPFTALETDYQYSQPIYTINQVYADLVIEMAE